MEKPKRYRIKSWILVENKGRELLTLEEAKAELEQAEFLQPENRYEIEEVE